MGNPIKHFNLVIHHRHLVIRNGFRMGIGWHCLRHDLSKFSKEEFGLSQAFYQGNSSPVYEERLAHNYYSMIAKHHTGRNKHHWEYWVDIFRGNLVTKTMPYIYALEYIADVLSASKTYNPKSFNNASAYNYVLAKIDHYYMTAASKEFIIWCLLRYKTFGFKGLKKAETKSKYQEIIKHHPDVEIYKINLSAPEIVPGEHD